MKREGADRAFSRQTAKCPEQLTSHGEDTAAYQVLRAHGLLDCSYRIDSYTQIDAVPPNATRGNNLLLKLGCLPFSCLFKTFEVDAGTLRLVSDGRGAFSFYGEGVHRICDPFYVVGPVRKYQNEIIQHGDLTLAVVNQGQIGYATDKGQPILLPPGLHQWKSPTMAFVQAYDLNNNVIRMGPLTLVTVDSGYSAVTEDNGEQKVLTGGKTYLLTHRNWKFQKYIPQKIQSSNLKRIEATSADNVLMAVDATVIWRITDVETAALNSAETIHKDGSDVKGNNINSLDKLTNDVLKQAEASLAAFIGAVEYSATFNVAAAVSHTPNVAVAVSETGDATGEASIYKPNPNTSPLFDLAKMQTCVHHANGVTRTYGVSILSINVVAAVPADKTLMVSLAQGAVASAEAQKFETVASGKASAAKIEAAGAAEAEVLRARGSAEAERVRAEAHKAAADMLMQNDLAARLATIDHTGGAIGKNSAFFFGANAADFGGLLTASIAGQAKHLLSGNH